MPTYSINTGRRGSTLYYSYPSSSYSSSSGSPPQPPVGIIPDEFGRSPELIDLSSQNLTEEKYKELLTTYVSLRIDRVEPNGYNSAGERISPSWKKTTWRRLLDVDNEKTQCEILRLDIEDSKADKGRGITLRKKQDCLGPNANDSLQQAAAQLQAELRDKRYYVELAQFDSVCRRIVIVCQDKSRKYSTPKYGGCHDEKKEAKRERTSITAHFKILPKPQFSAKDLYLEKMRKLYEQQARPPREYDSELRRWLNDQKRDDLRRQRDNRPRNGRQTMAQQRPFISQNVSIHQAPHQKVSIERKPPQVFPNGQQPPNGQMPQQRPPQFMPPDGGQQPQRPPPMQMAPNSGQQPQRPPPMQMPPNNREQQMPPFFQQNLTKNCTDGTGRSLPIIIQNHNGHSTRSHRSNYQLRRSRSRSRSRNTQCNHSRSRSRSTAHRRENSYYDSATSSTSFETIFTDDEGASTDRTSISSCLHVHKKSPRKCHRKHDKSPRRHDGKAGRDHVRGRSQQREKSARAPSLPRVRKVQFGDVLGDVYVRGRSRGREEAEGEAWMHGALGQDRHPRLNIHKEDRAWEHNGRDIPGVRPVRPRDFETRCEMDQPIRRDRFDHRDPCYGERLAERAMREHEEILRDQNEPMHGDFWLCGRFHGPGCCTSGPTRWRGGFACNGGLGGGRRC